MVKALLLTALLFLGACQTRPSGNFCDIARPKSLSDETVAAMSDAEVASILAHNETGAKLCGWKPKSETK